MDANFLPELISLVPLGIMLYFLWRERSHFRAMVPFFAAVACFFIARLSEMMIEIPLSPVAPLVTSSSLYWKSFNAAGDAADVSAVCFLIYGFIKSLKIQKTEEKHVEELEALLPLCSNCKKYREETGQWKPIEKYLLEHGGSKLTHGLCPECIPKFFPKAVQRN
ncbi:MAG TPA: hypothetical protein VI215_13135 [Bacteroidota bacterium]|jgi:hypothetical protein